MLKQHKFVAKMNMRQVLQKPMETTAPKQPSVAADEASCLSPLSKRQQRSMQRLQDFQEKKRATLVQELVSKGTDLIVAQGIVARDERKRLEDATAHHAAPMDAEAASAEGRPPGSQAAAAQRHLVSPKRARLSLPEAG